MVGEHRKTQTQSQLWTQDTKEEWVIDHKGNWGWKMWADNGAPLVNLEDCYEVQQPLPPLHQPYGFGNLVRNASKKTDYLVAKSRVNALCRYADFLRISSRERI